jgi:hypothetical protein
MDDYRRVVAEGIRLVPPEALCVDWIIPIVDYQFREPETRFELCFDRGEKFLRQVYPYWRRRSDRRESGPYYLRRVASLGEVSDEYMGVQAADVYTWTVYTFCEQSWLADSTAVIPESLQGVVREPPNSFKWDYETLRENERSRHRVLESKTRVPNWIERVQGGS